MPKKKFDLKSFIIIFLSKKFHFFASDIALVPMNRKKMKVASKMKRKQEEDDEYDRDMYEFIQQRSDTRHTWDPFKIFLRDYNYVEDDMHYREINFVAPDCQKTIQHKHWLDVPSVSLSVSHNVNRPFSSSETESGSTMMHYCGGSKDFVIVEFICRISGALERRAIFILPREMPLSSIVGPAQQWLGIEKFSPMFRNMALRVRGSPSPTHFLESIDMTIATLCPQKNRLVLDVIGQMHHCAVLCCRKMSPQAFVPIDMPHNGPMIVVGNTTLVVSIGIALTAWQTLVALLQLQAYDFCLRPLHFPRALVATELIEHYFPGEAVVEVHVVPLYRCNVAIRAVDFCHYNQGKRNAEITNLVSVQHLSCAEDLKFREEYHRAKQSDLVKTPQPPKVQRSSAPTSREWRTQLLEAFDRAVPFKLDLHTRTVELFIQVMAAPIETCPSHLLRSCQEHHNSIMLSLPAHTRIVGDALKKSVLDCAQEWPEQWELRSEVSSARQDKTTKRHFDSNESLCELRDTIFGLTTSRIQAFFLYGSSGTYSRESVIQLFESVGFRFCRTGFDTQGYFLKLSPPPPDFVSPIELQQEPHFQNSVDRLIRANEGAHDWTLGRALRNTFSADQITMVMGTFLSPETKCSCTILCIPGCLAQWAQSLDSDTKQQVAKELWLPGALKMERSYEVLFSKRHVAFVEEMSAKPIRFSKIASQEDVPLWSRFCRERIQRHLEDQPFDKEINAADAIFEAFKVWREALQSGSKKNGRNHFYAALEYLTGSLASLHKSKTISKEFYPRLSLKLK